MGLIRLFYGRRLRYPGVKLASSSSIHEAFVGKESWGEGVRYHSILVMTFAVEG